MKCPERFNVCQLNIRKPKINTETDSLEGEYHTLIEIQNFGECYKEKCAAWSEENQKCKKY